MNGTKPEERTQIYFKKEQIYQASKRKFEKWNGSTRNKELISSFQRFLFAKGTGGTRVAKLLHELIWVCNNIDKNLDELTYKDLETLVAHIYMKSDWSDRTKEDYIIVLKQFYNWYEDEDPRLTSTDHETQLQARKLYKYLKKHIKKARKPTNIDYSEVITDEDARLLIEKGCKSPLERAVVSVLHSTGVRVGELLGIRIKNIEIKEKYGMLRVNGKTDLFRETITKSPSLEKRCSKIYLILV